MKARHSSKRKGRPRKDAIRTESGRISRSISQLEREAVSWKRQRDNPGVEPVLLLGQEFGSVIHGWRRRGELAEKRASPDKPAGFIFTAQHLDTANRLHEIYQAYRLAIASKSPRSATDFGGVGGHDNLDPFDAERARRDQRAVDTYRVARRAILESAPFAMMAVETVIYDNRDCPDMLADLRLALNAVDRLWRMARAA